MGATEPYGLELLWRGGGLPHSSPHPTLKSPMWAKLLLSSQCSGLHGPQPWALRLSLCRRQEGQQPPPIPCLASRSPCPPPQPGNLTPSFLPRSRSRTLAWDLMFCPAPGPHLCMGCTWPPWLPAHSVARKGECVNSWDLACWCQALGAGCPGHGPPLSDSCPRIPIRPSNKGLPTCRR